MKNFTFNPEMERMSIGKLTSDLGEKTKEDHIQDILTNFLSSLPDITKNALNTSADEKDKIKSKSQVSLRNESMISANIQNETRILDDVAMIEELLKQAEEKNIIEKVDTNDVSASFDNIIGENATIGHGFDILRGDSPINSLETMESVTETDIENFTKSSVNDEIVHNLTKTAIEHIANETSFDKSVENVSNESMISANIQNETRILDDVAMIEELLKQAEEKNIIEKVDTNDVGASFDDIIGENATIGHGFDRLRGDSPINSLETMESVTETDIENFTKSSVNYETVQNLTKTAIEHIANEPSFDKSVENVTKSNVKKHVINTITNINETFHSNNTERDDVDNSLELMYNFHFILLCILLIFILIVIIRMFPTILQKLKKRLIWRSVNLNSPVKRLRIMDVNLQSMSPWNGAAYLVQEDNNSHLVQEDNHSPTDTNTEFSFVGSHATTSHDSTSHATTSHDSSMRYIRRSHDSSMTYVNRVYQHDNDLDRTIEYEMSPENLI